MMFGTITTYPHVIQFSHLLFEDNQSLKLLDNCFLELELA